jgi:hypothetical protein
MFTLTQTGADARHVRLVATAQLNESDFRAIAAKLGVAPFRARKTGAVLARTAKSTQTVVTRWNGKESVNTAQPGDMIVTNLDANLQPLIDGDGNRNVYVIRADIFPALYDKTEPASPLGDVYRARATVEAVALPGGFELVAPWGEMQRADCGILILNGAEVYGNHADTFAATYVILEESS